MAARVHVRSPRLGRPCWAKPSRQTLALGALDTPLHRPPPQESWEKRLPAGASKEAGWAAPRAVPPSGARPSSPRDRLQGGLGRPLGHGEAEAVKGTPGRRANLEAPLFLWAGTNPDFATSSEPDKWLICNINVTGYFRVNYDQDNWDRLMGQLESNHTVGWRPPLRPHISRWSFPLPLARLPRGARRPSGQGLWPTSGSSRMELTGPVGNPLGSPEPPPPHRPAPSASQLTAPSVPQAIPVLNRAQIIDDAFNLAR